MSESSLTRELKTSYPSNSNSEKSREKIKKKDEETPRKKIEPIVKGKVIRKKKTLGKKISEAFLGDDSRSVGDYLLQDILMPAVKNTLSELVGGGIDMWLFGERRSRNSYNRGNGRSYTSYGSYYGRERDKRDDDRDRGRAGDGRREVSRGARTRHDFNDIILETRGEAEDVLSHLVDLTVDYGVASVADYYELLNVEATYADQKYGWTNLRDAVVERDRAGYIIKLPHPRVID